jgi:hypothetical protein
MFAIATFRNDGPLKTFAALRAANVHNARLEPLPHAMPDAPRPRHLIGTGDLAADVRMRLKVAGINPAKLRKNGVIAYEAILTASPEFFEQGTADEQRERLDRWIVAQVEWAKARYGANRIASLVLHLDEKTPHQHLVVLPLVYKADKRRRDRAMGWSLVGSSISGPGRYDELQTQYAGAMAQFGLRRGIIDSGRKYEPIPVYLARIAAAGRELDAAQVAVDDRATLLDQAATDLKKAKADHAERVIEDQRRLAADRDALRIQQVQAAEARMQTLREVASQRKEHEAAKRANAAAQAALTAAEGERAAAAIGREAAKAMSDRINAHRLRLAPVFRAASEFQRRVERTMGKPLTPAASSTVEALRSLIREAAMMAPPANEDRADVLDAYALIKRQAAAIGK